MLQTIRAWLRRPRQAAPPPESTGLGASRLGDVLTLREAWRTAEGFRRPDWAKIGAWINGRSADDAERAAMWHDASLQWLRVLTQDLGGSYGVAESRLCLLLSARSPFAARGLVAECDSILLHLRTRLGSAAWRWPHGKHAVLMFEEEDEYYRYISDFYEDGGAYGTSDGVFLPRGYAHTALPSGQRNSHVLMHEFVHLCLSQHKSIPKWLNEGLAKSLARETFDPRARGFDRDSAKAQRTFWTPATIQRFWSGEAFRVDEERKMSYNLAELLVGIMMRQLGDLGPFIASAQRRDGGESAARECFDLGLGEVAAAVLGEGDWQPQLPLPAGGAPRAEA